MAGVLLLQSRKGFSWEAIYSPNYSKVLSVTAAYDYALTKAKGSGEDNLIIATLITGTKYGCLAVSTHLTGQRLEVRKRG